MFHGLTPAFLSTLVIYILGILLIVTFSYWVKLLQRQPGKLTFNYWYNRSANVIPNYSEKMTNSYVTDYSRNNLVIIFGALILLTFVTVFSKYLSTLILKTLVRLEFSKLYRNFIIKCCLF